MWRKQRIRCSLEIGRCLCHNSELVFNSIFKIFLAFVGLKYEFAHWNRGMWHRFAGVVQSPVLLFRWRTCYKILLDSLNRLLYEQSTFSNEFYRIIIFYLNKKNWTEKFCFRLSGTSLLFQQVMMFSLFYFLLFSFGKCKLGRLFLSCYY
jgi:hypothetical protein